MPKQSPPIPVICGSTTHSTATAVTAASAALPPARSVSTAARLANGCEVAAMPSPAMTGERPGSWKSRLTCNGPCLVLSACYAVRMIGYGWLPGRDAMTLTLAQARTILDQTLAAAREKKFKPLGVAVVDNRGALRAYAEEDGNPILRSKIASGKAFGSVAFGSGVATAAPDRRRAPAHGGGAGRDDRRRAGAGAGRRAHPRQGRARSSARSECPATPPTTTRRRRSPASRPRASSPRPAAEQPLHTRA